MKRAGVWFAALTVLLAGCVSRPPPDRHEDGRIVNGLVADYGTAPWQVHLTWRDGMNDHSCGAVLIRPDWVLTARHCVEPEGTLFDEQSAIAALSLSAGHLFVGRAAPADDASLRQTRRVDQVLVAEAWQALGRGFKAGDLALLHVAQAFATNPRSLRPIALPPQDNPAFPESGTGQISGWGVTTWSAGGDIGSGSPQLLYADVDILPNADCAKRIGVRPDRTGQLVCAWKQQDNEERNSTTCSGDSGGPLVLTGGTRKILVGVLSGAMGCGPSPSVFTRISFHSNWINAKIESKP